MSITRRSRASAARGRHEGAFGHRSPARRETGAPGCSWPVTLKRALLTARAGPLAPEVLMRRREFVALLSVSTASPLATFAQQRKLPTIGFLGAGTPSTWI